MWLLKDRNNKSDDFETKTQRGRERQSKGRRRRRRRRKRKKREEKGREKSWVWCQGNENEILVGNGTVSVMMATLLFIIPNKKEKGEKLMDWNTCKKLPWSLILLLGAGFAIAEGVESSGLANVLSETLDFLERAPYLAIAPAVCLISSIITEFITSNNATTTLVVPLLIQIAKSMHLHPLLLMVPGAIGAQFAFLLPTATPSNAVGFTTGHIELKDMIKIGLPLKIAGIATLTLLMPTLGAYVFETNKVV